MMATLLLRLAGPLQAWGTRSRFTDRDTERFPTKSGLVGLLCAALGRPRQQPADDLAALRLAVRADLAGRIETDFHTAGNVPAADGNKAGQRTVTSYRHYLADAVFLAVLEGDAALLERLAAALQRPVWPLALGRRSCPPSLPIFLGAPTAADLPTVLNQTRWLPLHDWLPDDLHRLRPWRARPERVPPPQDWWVECETAVDDPSGAPRWDVPVGPLEERRFALRRVVRRSVAELTGGTPCT